jgi:hypothetical protein
MSQIVRQIGTWATVTARACTLEAAAGVLPPTTSPGDREAATGLAIGSPLPLEHQRLRNMLRAMMGGPARRT